MPVLLMMLLAPIFLESPRYSNEALRIERSTDHQITSVVIRRPTDDFVIVDHIETSWRGSDIATFRLRDCPGLANLVEPGRGPSRFKPQDRLADGTPVITLHGPGFRVVADARYSIMLGSPSVAGDALSPVGQWAALALRIVDRCRAPIAP